MKTQLFLTALFTAICTPFASADFNATLLGEITNTGQKITGAALEYPTVLLAADELQNVFNVQTSLDGNTPEPRTVLRAYSNDRPEFSTQPKAGRYVILQFASTDKNAVPFEIIKANTEPMSFKGWDKAGKAVDLQKVQAYKVPHYFGERLQYQINQTLTFPLLNGETAQSFSQTVSSAKLSTVFLDEFRPFSVSLDQPENRLTYRFYSPKLDAGKRYPLTIFLHGSGQVGSDNLAPLLFSRGAVATLAQEPGFVAVPQYSSVFDPFDKGGGIHWQTPNRQKLVLKMVSQILQKHPEIDRTRIYLLGLSRGAEGALQVMLREPKLFAAAVLASGREAFTKEWQDGKATDQNLAPLAKTPIWFFHSPQDKIAPVAGDRKNVQILTSLHAPIRYTELPYSAPFDSGYITANAHNSWEVAFSSPVVIQWLLSQHN